MSSTEPAFRAGRVPSIQSPGRWLRRFGVVTLFALALGGGWWGWSEWQARTAFGSAETAYARLDLTRSLRDAQVGLSWRPNSARGALIAARCLSRMGRVDEAEGFYRRAGSLGIDDLHARGDALLRLGKTGPAAGVYDEIVARRPGDVEALRRLAACRMAASEWAAALRVADRLIADSKTEILGRALEATIRHTIGEHGPSIAAYERVLALDPTLNSVPIPSRILWDQLSRDLIAEGRHVEARRYLVRALAQGDDPVLLSLLAQTHAIDSELDRAEALWRRAIEVDPNHCDPWLHLGRQALRRQAFAEALPLLSRAAALSPESAEPLYNLGLAYQGLGQTARAEALIRQAESLRRARPEARDEPRPAR